MRQLLRRIEEIAATPVRYGFWRIFVLLRREGQPQARLSAALPSRTSPAAQGSAPAQGELGHRGRPEPAQGRGCGGRGVERLRRQRELPQRIQTDSGSEFISIAMDRWACDHGVTMDYSRPDKPADHPLIESFNGSFRDECLNAHGFLSLEDAC